MKGQEDKGGVSVLTEFGASDVGQNPEAFRLQVGSAASPVSHVQGLSWPDHCLVHWRCTIYHRLLDGQNTTAGQRVQLDVIGTMMDVKAQPLKLKLDHVLSAHDTLPPNDIRVVEYLHTKNKYWNKK